MLADEFIHIVRTVVLAAFRIIVYSFARVRWTHAERLCEKHMEMDRLQTKSHGSKKFMTTHRIHNP